MWTRRLVVGVVLLIAAVPQTASADVVGPPAGTQVLDHASCSWFHLRGYKRSVFFWEGTTRLKGATWTKLSVSAPCDAYLAVAWTSDYPVRVGTATQSGSEVPDPAGPASEGLTAGTFLQSNCERPSFQSVDRVNPSQVYFNAVGVFTPDGPTASDVLYAMEPDDGHFCTMWHRIGLPYATAVTYAERRISDGIFDPTSPDDRYGTGMCSGVYGATLVSSYWTTRSSSQATSTIAPPAQQENGQIEPDTCHSSRWGSVDLGVWFCGDKGGQVSFYGGGGFDTKHSRQIFNRMARSGPPVNVIISPLSGVFRWKNGVCLYTHGAGGNWLLMCGTRAEMARAALQADLSPNDGSKVECRDSRTGKVTVVETTSLGAAFPETVCSSVSRLDGTATTIPASKSTGAGTAEGASSPRASTCIVVQVASSRQRNGAAIQRGVAATDRAGRVASVVSSDLWSGWAPGYFVAVVPASSMGDATNLVRLLADEGIDALVRTIPDNVCRKIEAGRGDWTNAGPGGARLGRPSPRQSSRPS